MNSNHRAFASVVAVVLGSVAAVEGCVPPPPGQDGGSEPPPVGTQEQVQLDKLEFVAPRITPDGNDVYDASRISTHALIRLGPLAGIWTRAGFSWHLEYSISVGPTPGNSPTAQVAPGQLLGRGLVAVNPHSSREGLITIPLSTVWDGRASDGKTVVPGNFQVIVSAELHRDPPQAGEERVVATAETTRQDLTVAVEHDEREEAFLLAAQLRAKIGRRPQPATSSSPEVMDGPALTETAPGTTLNDVARA